MVGQIKCFLIKFIKYLGSFCCVFRIGLLLCGCVWDVGQFLNCCGEEGRLGGIYWFFQVSLVIGLSIRGCVFCFFEFLGRVGGKVGRVRVNENVFVLMSCLRRLGCSENYSRKSFGWFVCGVCVCFVVQCWLQFCMTLRWQVWGRFCVMILLEYFQYGLVKFCDDGKVFCLFCLIWKLYVGYRVVEMWLV